MLATIFTGTARYRRWIIGAAVVLAASMLLLLLRIPPHGTGEFALTVSFTLVVMVAGALAIAAGSRQRPAVLTVDPPGPAFRALPGAGDVYQAVILTFLSTRGVLSLRSTTDTGQDSHHFGDVLLTDLVVLSVGLCTVVLVLMWRETGLELRPDGLVNRSALGTLTVSWEALAPGYPQSGRDRSLVLAYARPELVRRRYLASRRRLDAGDLNVDPLFLGAVIAHYVAYPQHRAAIGTQAEYDRLRHALNNLAGPLPATSQ